MTEANRLAAVAILLAATTASAGGVIPAVNLPPGTPDFVRDQTARSLALARDTLGWTVHPFRGEFHGLGMPAGGYSKAYDLSANGRVVVGADTIGDVSQAFVWSPWTGRATYDMRPPGVGGDTVATGISADGVYVVGLATSPVSQIDLSGLGIFPLSDYSRADTLFRWSLAGSQVVDETVFEQLLPAGVSSDGSVVVGNRKWDDYPWQSGDQRGLHVSLSLTGVRAYRYTVGGDREVLTPDLDDRPYSNYEAIAVSNDGETVLVNGFDKLSFYTRVSEPILWMADGSLRYLDQAPHPSTDVQGSALYDYPPASISTIATAISADGSAVVGFSRNTAPRGPEFEVDTQERAVLWRDGDGWIDMGEVETFGHSRFIGGRAVGVSGNGETVVGTATILSSCLECDCATLSCDVIDRKPFIWDQQRGMRDLANVLRLDYGLNFDGWWLGEAAAISDDGTTIIGNGLRSAGQREAWRAVLHRNTPHGDVDFDGDVDQDDYQRLIGNLGLNSDEGAVFYADGDLNADGVVDQADANTLLGLYQHLQWGDFNADGRVDSADYTLWRDHAGRFTGGLADSNGDGWVNEADLVAWRTHFGEFFGTVFPNAVPEPGAAWLVALASLAASRRRKPTDALR